MRKIIKTLVSLSVLVAVIGFISGNVWAMKLQSLESTPSIPRLLIPEDGSHVTEIVGEQKYTFRWAEVSGAAFYHFQLCTDIECIDILAEVTDCRETWYTVRNLINDVTYYWRVRAIDATGLESHWSEKFKFILGYPDRGKGEESYYKGVEIGVGALAARKDTNMLCLDGCSKKGTHLWDASHTGEASTGTHSAWGCWAAAITMMNHYYGGTITQDEVRYHVDGKNEPEDDFGHGAAGGATDAETTTGLGWALKNAALNYSRAKPTEAQVKAFIDADRPLQYSTPVHWMVLDGYRNAGADFEVRLLNTDNDGTVEWRKYSTHAFDSYFCPVATAEGRDKDARIDQDTDGDGINDFDEEERFHTLKNSNDSDTDDLQDKIEVQSYIFDKDENYVSKTTGRHNQVMTHFDGDKLRPEKDSDTDDGGIEDGEEDIDKDGIFNTDNEIDPFEPDDDKGFVFVIDDTGSMWDEIAAAKAAAKKVLDDNKAAGIKRLYVLITFKDGPGLIRGESASEDEMKGYIDALSASGGAGCPESSLTAIRLGADLVEDSDIMMMTDASSNSYGVDYTYATWGEVLLTAFKLLLTNNRLHSIVYGECPSGSTAAAEGTGSYDDELMQCPGCYYGGFPGLVKGKSSGEEGYNRVSTESGGLYFRISTGETEKAVEVILRTSTSDSTVAYYDGDGSAAYTVPVDSTITQMQIVLNGDTGSSVSLEVKNPSGVVVSDATDGVSVVEVGGSTFYLIEDPALVSGNWTATVSGAGTYRLSAGASTSNPMDYTGDTSVGVGSALHMEASIREPVTGIRFEIINLDGSHPVEVALTSADGLTYTGTQIMDTVGSYRFRVTGNGNFQRMYPGKITVGNLDVIAPSPINVTAGTSLTHTFQIKNLGTDADTYDLFTSSSMGWADLSGVPGSVTIPAIGIEEIDIPVNVPADATSGQIDILSLQAVSQANSLINDTDETETRVSVVYDFDGDGDVDVEDIMMVASRWNTKAGDAEYDAKYDLDDDGDIDVVDIMKVAAQWGWSG